MCVCVCVCDDGGGRIKLHAVRGGVGMTRE